MVCGLWFVLRPAGNFSEFEREREREREKELSIAQAWLGICNIYISMYTYELVTRWWWGK